LAYLTQPILKRSSVARRSKAPALSPGLFC
jgi:hypothetical protein